jgi:beta-glucosidase
VRGKGGLWGSWPRSPTPIRSLGAHEVGNPNLYGGGEEVLFYRRHGCTAAVLPGVTSALVAPLASLSPPPSTLPPPHPLLPSYNAINGVPTCGSPGLLTEALRGHMGFDGFVVSDYDAWANIVSTHKYVSTWGEAATVGLNAGLDQEGGGGPTYPPVQTGIPAAVAVGNVTLAQVQLAMRRLFRVRLRLGMFDPPLQNPYDAINHTQVASPAHLALAEDAARKGMTLLKNSVPAGGPASGAPALPLSPAALVGKKVAVVGPLWNVSKQLLGSYSDPSCCLAGIPAFFDELVARLPGAHVSAAAGCGDANCDGKTAPVNFTEATALVSDASAVIAVMGMGQSQFACGGDSDRAACESEGYDRLTCALPGQQSAFLQAVRAAAPAGVPVVVVFVHGTSFCLEPGFLAAADAILDAWYPGMRGAPAMADAIVGAFSPSGRSPVTWYSSDAALPSNRSDASPYASASSPGWTYRYYTPEVVQADPPVFTFGEGLSYSTFAVESVAAPTSAGPCDAINVSVTVRNTGAVDSDVVVALYASQAASVPSPIARLVGFARVFVPAGQTATAALSTVTPESRAVVHDDGAGDIYSYAGKRWNEAGTVNFRVSLGAHNGHVEGGTVFTVQQTGTQDLSTC